MKKAILQIWEESHSDDTILPDGASLHLSLSDRNDYVDSFYKYREGITVPEVYSRVCGDFSEVTISEGVYMKLNILKNILLQEHEFNNLVNFKEII